MIAMSADRYRQLLENGGFHEMPPAELDQAISVLLNTVETLADLCERWREEYAALVNRAEQLQHERDRGRRMH